MQAHAIVFNAARDGRLIILRNYLAYKLPEEVKSLANTVTCGSTPLVMACRNGHIEVVRFLIEKCHADVEQVGTVTFDNDTIKGASPLWCAAASGHYSIVRALVNYKASVNSATTTNSTPLRAACFDGYFEIAQYLIHHGADVEVSNRHGHTCLMIACYKGHLRICEFLLRCGADVNRKSMRGNTALHDCAESGNLEIMRLLLLHGAVMDKDSRGTTPLLSAAITGHANVVEYIINSTPCAKNVQADALELLGATFLDKETDKASAVVFWTRAMHLRLEDANSLILKRDFKSSIGSYVNATEVTSFEQLREVTDDPDAARIEALLIRERVLGPAHPDTVYYIRYQGAVYADRKDFDSCIKLWIYALDTQQSALEPLSPMTLTSLVAFAELFSYMLSDSWPWTRITPLVIFHGVMDVFQRILKEMKSALGQTCPINNEDDDTFQHILIIAIHLIGFMCKLRPNLTDDDESEMKQKIYEMVKLKPRGCEGRTPLHIACFKDTEGDRYSVSSFPSLEVVELLLEVGACPNETDDDKNTPLHVAAMNGSKAETFFEVLLIRGAHLDSRNILGETALELCDFAFDVYPLQHTTLQCLCANVINDFNIPYRGIVPKSLQTFVEAH